VRTLIANDLIDEPRLMVFPVAVGGGLRVFPDDRTKVSMELTELVRYDSGVLLHVYRSLSSPRAHT
jgi:dihydrofolate reductase